MQLSWEEKNCTKWASNYIKTVLFASSESNSLASSLEGFKQLKDIEIVSASDVSGSANITHSRGKVRYLYEFTVELSVLVFAVGREDPFKASFKIEDCINDQLDDAVASTAWTGTGTAPPAGIIRAYTVYTVLAALYFETLTTYTDHHANITF